MSTGPEAEDGQLDQGQVTRLLNAVRQGDKAQEGELLELVYNQLRRLARQQMSRERPGHTLQATALVHEAYARIFGRDNIQWSGRGHFLAIASREFRRVLIEHARQVKAEKRGGGGPKLSIDELAAAGLGEPGMPPPTADADALTVHELMEQLAVLDPEAARVVELKFFAGLTDEEAAAESGLSIHKVRRHWTFARSWFLSRLNPKMSEH